MKNKMETIFEIIIWIVAIIELLFIIAFIIMVIKLINYDRCKEDGFQTTYCEKYKDF